MLCEECSHFLEIAEAIRSLGLTILKGVTEAHGEKTWICFVVENRKQGDIFNILCCVLLPLHLRLCVPLVMCLPKTYSLAANGTEQSYAQNGYLMVACANSAIQGYKLAAMACHLLEVVTLAVSVTYCECFEILDWLCGFWT
ncbi:hypothetical protein Golob_020414 [Gossypium lobatum]|uniref:Uncharacterized protein n=1 Tax=Gossypium lobatum TaxID=34289 RepID=A0A7J8LA97_9ROSI|nr:hypothetical protein [Gossypium lobatum]